MAGLPHRPPLALGALTHELAVLVHLRRAEVGRLDKRGVNIYRLLQWSAHAHLAVALLLAPVDPLPPVHAGALGRQPCALQQLARLPGPARAVGDTHLRYYFITQTLLSYRRPALLNQKQSW